LSQIYICIFFNIFAFLLELGFYFCLESFVLENPLLIWSVLRYVYEFETDKSSPNLIWISFLRVKSCDPYDQASCMIKHVIHMFCHLNNPISQLSHIEMEMSRLVLKETHLKLSPIYFVSLAFFSSIATFLPQLQTWRQNHQTPYIDHEMQE
jgi:hypothetical protein